MKDVTIFDYNKLPDRRLYISKTISPNILEYEKDLGLSIRLVKEDMARELANVILNNGEFFKHSMDHKYNTLTYRADCIVMTTEEYAEFAKENFKKGVDHASGFRPTPW